jgi:hypothetical protein
MRLSFPFGFLFVALLACEIAHVHAAPIPRVKLNPVAVAYAEQLLQQKRCVADKRNAWGAHRPSPAAENAFIHQNGFGAYAKWYLGIDERHAANSKARYKFPYGDFQNVHRCALLAIKVRARQHGYLDIENAATKLERELKAATSDAPPR